MYDNRFIKIYNSASINRSFIKFKIKTKHFSYKPNKISDNQFSLMIISFKLFDFIVNIGFSKLIIFKKMLSIKNLVSKIFKTKKTIYLVR